MLDIKTGILDKLKNIPTLNEITGGVGEQMTKLMAKIELPDTLVLHDVLIDGEENQTSQIDLLLIGDKGIYVVEVKTYTDARIYGDAKKQNWYYYRGGQKYEIYSPYKQNQNHIKHLKRFLTKFGEIPYFSILAVLCEDFKVTNLNEDPGKPDTIMLNGLLSLRKAVNKLSAGRPSILSEERRKEISDYIMQYQHVGKEARREHKENVKAITAEKEEVKRQNLCPYCKTALVLRKGKYGDFYGCSNYPRCKYTGKV